MKAWVDFKAIKEAADFRTVLAHYGLKLTAKGPELTGLCPFHRETRPSFRVNVEKGVFHCFGCGAKGNVIDFVSRKEGTTIRAAAALVAEWCGIETGVVGARAQVIDLTAAVRASLDQKAARTPKRGDTRIPAPTEIVDPRASQRPSPTPEEGETAESRPAAPEEAGEAERPAGAEEPLEEGNKPLTFALKLSDHPYLASRGLDPETTNTFGLGYCSRGVMKGRIAIPIHDEGGNLVAYAGRWPGEDPPEGEDRYKLPPGFKKSHVLFNLNRVRGAAQLVIVEGYFGVMRLHELGLSAVALMGRSLSPEQEELLMASGAKRLVLMLDGDGPGREATAEILPRLARRFYVRVVEPPNGAQPDTIPAEDLMKLLSFRS